VAVTSAAMVVVGLASSVPSSIVANGVVTGLPPLWVEVVSILITVPAALMLFFSSLYGALRQKRYQLLYIAAGTAVITAAGSLYLVSFPASLYYAEFVGIVLLFLGFVKVPGISAPAAKPQAAA